MMTEDTHDTNLDRRVTARHHGGHFTWHLLLSEGNHANHAQVSVKPQIARGGGGWGVGGGGGEGVGKWGAEGAAGEGLILLRGFPTRMVYLHYISWLRYTTLVGILLLLSTTTCPPVSRSLHTWKKVNARMFERQCTQTDRSRDPPRRLSSLSTTTRNLSKLATSYSMEKLDSFRLDQTLKPQENKTATAMQSQWLLVSAHWRGLGVLLLLRSMWWPC